MGHVEAGIGMVIDGSMGWIFGIKISGRETRLIFACVF